MNATRFPETFRLIAAALSSDRRALRAQARELAAAGFGDHFIADRLCDALARAEGSSAGAPATSTPRPAAP